MGLNVISNIVGSVNNAASAVSGDAGLSVAGDFAALLSGQTLAALLSPGAALVPGKSADAASGAPESDKSTEPGAATPLTDPATLIALMGNPQLQPRDVPAVSKPILDEDTKGALPSAQLANPETMLRREAASQKADIRSESRAQATPLPVIANTATSARESLSAQPETANIAGPAELPGNSPTFSASLAALAPPRENIAHHQGTVSTPVHAEAWPQHFAEKVVWLAKNDQQTAQINLNPAQLGPVQITLNLNGDQATAVFASPHAEVRQAIESSMPQLREMLASAGISLGDTNVGTNLGQNNPNNAFNAPNRAQSSLENAILPANDNAPVAGIATPLHQGRGLVDLFA